MILKISSIIDDWRHAAAIKLWGNIIAAEFQIGFIQYLPLVLETEVFNGTIQQSNK